MYFSSLFYTLKKLTLARDWPEFFTMGLNEDSLDTVYGNARLLAGGPPVRVVQDDFRVQFLGLPKEAPGLVPGLVAGT